MSELESTRASEIYKPIEGFPGYRVSDFGNVQTSWTRGTYAKTTDRWRPRILQINVYGYPVVSLKRNKVAKLCYVHHLVLDAFVGHRPKGCECRHLDGNPENNRLDNLKWGTHKENQLDKIEHGTILYGERSHFAKLKTSDVKEIRRLLDLGHSQRCVRERFGVSPNNMACIARRATWKHI